jgi:hypothetical protein
MKIYAPLLVAGALLSPLLSIAGPADYVYTPAVTYGEKEIDFKTGTASSKVSGKTDTAEESATSLGFGYGATQWWFTEMYIKYKRENGEGTKLDALEWENKFQLTEQGQYPVDVGFLLEIERPMDHTEGWEVKWGPLFQKDFGKIQVNANLLFQRNYDAATANNLLFMYQWQVKYRWKPTFEYGVQAFSEMGTVDNWLPQDEQSHKIGPAVFGKLPLGHGEAIKYNAAWLFGNGNATTPDNTFRLQVEYEF